MKPAALADSRWKRLLVQSAVVSLVAWVALQIVAPRQKISWTRQMMAAAETMQQATNMVAQFCGTAGIEIDATRDPNGTCLIGPDYTPLFTTLGQLEAKRTTTNPDVAALLVHLLQEIGVTAGDTIAVGASASFPALLIAILTAAEAIDAVPVTIISLGSSSFGATRPQFNLLHIYQLLLNEESLRWPAAAVSLGGADDIGSEFDPALRESLLLQISASQIPLIDNPDLNGNVNQRLAVYRSSPDSRVAAFVNIGGSDANLGTSTQVLEVSPGINTALPAPPKDGRGVLFEMAAQQVPVIHLLHVRGLAQRHGLPWDPIPLPQPGTTELLDGMRSPGWPFWLLTAAYCAALGLIAFHGGYRRATREQARGL